MVINGEKCACANVLMVFAFEIVTWQKNNDNKLSPRIERKKY